MAARKLTLEGIVASGCSRTTQMECQKMRVCSQYALNSGSRLHESEHQTLARRLKETERGNKRKQEHGTVSVAA